MTSDAVLALHWLLTSIWRLCTGFHLPGTNITPAHILFIGLFVRFLMRFIPALLNTSTMVFGGVDIHRDNKR